MEAELLQLGALGIIFFVCIKEFFAFLKVKKLNGNGNGTNDKMLNELRLMNNNHLGTLTKAVTDGNEKLIEAINDNGKQQIQILGKIEGMLSK